LFVRIQSEKLHTVASLFIHVFLSPSLSLSPTLSLICFLPLLFPASSLPPFPASQVGNVASTTRVQELELELSSLKEATSALQCDLHSRISDLESSLQVAREDLDGAKASSDGDCRYVICSEEQHSTTHSITEQAVTPLLSAPHEPPQCGHIPYPPYPLFTYLYSLSLVLPLPLPCPI
jgi:hypothetical protein